MTHNNHKLDRKFFAYFAISSILQGIKGLNTVPLNYLFISYNCLVSYLLIPIQPFTIDKNQNDNTRVRREKLKYFTNWPK